MILVLIAARLVWQAAKAAARRQALKSGAQAPMPVVAADTPLAGAPAAVQPAVQHQESGAPVVSSRDAGVTPINDARTGQRTVVDDWVDGDSKH